MAANHGRPPQQHKDAGSAIAQLGGKLGELTEALKQSRSANHELTRELEQNKQEQNRLRNALQRSQGNESTLASELENLKSAHEDQIRAAKAEVDSVRQELEMSESARSLMAFNTETRHRNDTNTHKEEIEVAREEIHRLKSELEACKQGKAQQVSDIKLQLDEQAITHTETVYQLKGELAAARGASDFAERILRDEFSRHRSSETFEVETTGASKKPKLTTQVSTNATGADNDRHTTPSYSSMFESEDSTPIIPPLQLNHRNDRRHSTEPSDTIKRTSMDETWRYTTPTPHGNASRFLKRTSEVRQNSIRSSRIHQQVSHVGSAMPSVEDRTPSRQSIRSSVRLTTEPPYSAMKLQKATRSSAAPARNRRSDTISFLPELNSQPQSTPVTPSKIGPEMPFRVQTVTPSITPQHTSLGSNGRPVIWVEDGHIHSSSPFSDSGWDAVCDLWEKTRKSFDAGMPGWAELATENRCMRSSIQIKTGRKESMFWTVESPGSYCCRTCFNVGQMCVGYNKITRRLEVLPLHPSAVTWEGGDVFDIQHFLHPTIKQSRSKAVSALWPSGRLT
jgi:hypothetical protein